MRDLTVPTPTPLPSRAEIAALGFLAQYRGETLKLYRVHLKIFFAWCADHGLDPLEVSRTHLDAGVPLRDVQTAARHSDARMTSRYDRNRNALDRHASHVLSAFVAGAA